MTPSSEEKFHIILFPSVSHVMKAEKMLIAAGISVKIIPLPKSISSDCGVCIRIPENSLEKTSGILDNQFESIEYRQL